MLVTLLGISIDSKDLQPEKVLLPIDVTLLGMDTDLRASHE